MISFFLIFFWGLSNKRFTICVAGFSYLFFVLLQLISMFIWVFHRLILIILFSKLISALTFFNHFILIKTFSFFDSITCNLIGNFFSWILKLSLTFLKTIMSFPFADVKILLLNSSIWVFNFSFSVSSIKELIISFMSLISLYSRRLISSCFCSIFLLNFLLFS